MESGTTVAYGTHIVRLRGHHLMVVHIPTGLQKQGCKMQVLKQDHTSLHDTDKFKLTVLGSCGFLAYRTLFPAWRASYVFDRLC